MVVMAGIVYAVGNCVNTSYVHAVKFFHSTYYEEACYGYPEKSR